MAWAAEEYRILLTHDVATIIRFAYDRVVQGLPMPGVIKVSTNARVEKMIEDILLVIDCSSDDELEGQIQYLPF